MPGAEFFVFLFFAADAGAVLVALYLLHRQRCIDDITDQRYRDHPHRARRTLGR